MGWRWNRSRIKRGTMEEGGKGKKGVECKGKVRKGEHVQGDSEEVRKTNGMRVKEKTNKEET